MSTRRRHARERRGGVTRARCGAAGVPQHACRFSGGDWYTLEERSFMRNTLFLACIIAIGIACGCTSTDGGSGSNQVQGLVNGKAFNAKEAMSNHVLSG